MSKLFHICILLGMLYVAAGNSYGQVIYTTNGSCPPNQPNYFGVASSSCWEKSGIDCNPGVLSPPVSGTPGCPIVININHPINLGTFNFGPNVTVNVNSGGIWNITNNITQTGQADSRLVINGGQVNAGGVIMNNGIPLNITTFRIETRNSGIFNVTNAFNTGNNSLVELSGDNTGNVIAGSINMGLSVNLNVNSGGKFNVSGNLNQLTRSVSNILIDGGQLNINGSVLLAAGTGPITTLKINTRNLGLFKIGTSLNLGNDAFVEISGDDSGNVEVGSVELAQGSRLDILTGGRLTSLGNTRYNGGSGIINVSGFFKTSQLEVSGGNGIKFNTLGEARVEIVNDLLVSGTSSITFGGTSEINIGGKVDIKGNSASVTVQNTAKVFACGQVSGNIIGQIGPCSITPVDYVYIESAYSKVSNAAILTWATSKEWENSRFEIERSVGGISDFVKVGEVQGMGWKDSITEYEYTDRNLPLTGGNVYYRLKQVDINGEFSLSKVMSVKIDGVQFTQGVWRAYPNPTDSDQLRVSLLDRTQYNDENITFKIIHPTAVSKAVSVASENEMNEAISQMIRNVPKGVFVIELIWGQKIEHIKVLKK